MDRQRTKLQENHSTAAVKGKSTMISSYSMGIAITVVNHLLQVGRMEAKISEGKRKKVEFIEKAKEHEQMIQGLKSAFGDSLSYLEGKEGIGRSAEVTPRLSKSLPLATPSDSSTSLDNYHSQSFHTPSSKRSYGLDAPHSSGQRYDHHSYSKPYPH